MAASSDRFPAIGDYAFLSDCHTGALLAPDGSVEWMCLPRFDSPSVFAAILDRDAGQFRIGPSASVPISRRYRPGTNVLETTWATESGWLVVHDALAIGPWREDAVDVHTRAPTDMDARHMLVRHVECIGGEVEVELFCNLMADYGRRRAVWSIADGGRHIVEAGEEEPPLRLYTDVRLGIDRDVVSGRHWLREGECCFVALGWGEQVDGPATAEEALEEIRTTERYWRRWLSRGRFPDHPWRTHLQRSALVLKGLTYLPTGATVAALTTSLPETPGGERNWDYRYTWIRDATFTLWSMHILGFEWEARDFMQFIADICRAEGPEMQVMYGIDGEKDLTESTLDHLSGYGGAKPVRIGNGAFDQRQNDVFGALLDSVYIHTKAREHIDNELWEVVEDQVEGAVMVWENPRPGNLGGARRGAALRLLEADVLGGARPRRPAGPRPRRGGARRALGRDRRADPRADPRARRHRRGSLPPALRHRLARRLDPADPAGSLPATGGRARPQHRAGNPRAADP